MGGLKCSSKELRGGELVVDSVWNDASASTRGVDLEISGLVCSRQILTEVQCYPLAQYSSLCNPGFSKKVLLWILSLFTRAHDPSHIVHLV